MSDKILILQLSRLGDILQSTLLLNSLKCGGNTIYLLGDEKNIEIAKEIELIDHFIPLEINTLLSSIKKDELTACFDSIDDFIKVIDSNNFKYIVNLNHSDINFYISSLIKSEVKRGFKIENSNFINFIYEQIKDRKSNRFNLVDIFNFFSDNPIRSRNLFINRNFTSKNIEFINKISKNRKNLVFHLGAGHKLREWGVSNFAKLGNLILKNFDYNIILTGSKGEKSLAKAFTLEIEDDFKDKIINLTGKTDIPLLKAVLAKSEIVFSTDTGVMHLAAATLTKNISIFYGSAFVYETAPYNEDSIIISPNIFCYPCLEGEQQCKNIDCKRLVTPEDIMQLFLFKINLIDYLELIKYFKQRLDITVYTPYFDEYGICYQNIIEDNREDNYKKRRRGFELCMRKI